MLDEKISQEPLVMHCSPNSSKRDLISGETYNGVYLCRVVDLLKKDSFDRMCVRKLKNEVRPDQKIIKKALMKYHVR